ncbi:hypothetical protein ACTMTF_02765 [Nonomuraea sp. ZG12]|uniref:hypothetical protein n=1 Tax=Nonomuraea sp. ZG12 TaxID=3452207 RepID=UPI003F8A67D5
MMYGPPEYPRASSSPTIILLVSGMAALLGFLLGFFTGLGSGGTTSTPGPRVTVTVEGPAPSEQPPAQPSAQPSGQPSASPSATAPPATSAPPATGAPVPSTGAPATGLPQDGTSPDLLGAFGSMRTLVVGVDIQPGTYRTTGPITGVDKCYWARLKSTGGDVGDVIAAGLPPGPTSVTILATDKGFQTAGCAEWIKM